MSAIGSLVKREREKQELSQGDLGVLFGVSRPFVNQIEAGSKIPADRDVVERLRRFLNLDTTDQVDFLCGRIPPDLEDWLTSNLQALRFVRKLYEARGDYRLSNLAAIIDDLAAAANDVPPIDSYPDPVH